MNHDAAQTPGFMAATRQPKHDIAFQHAYRACGSGFASTISQLDRMARSIWTVSSTCSRGAWHRRALTFNQKLPRLHGPDVPV